MGIAATIMSMMTVLGSTVAQRSNTADKVHVVLYMESLCPYCANYLSENLDGLFKDGIKSIVDLQVVPWVRSTSRKAKRHGVECTCSRRNLAFAAGWHRMHTGRHS
jgi:protein-disulfide isomerase